MKKYLRIMIILTVTFICSIFLESCCHESFQIIGSGELKAYEIGQRTEIDTISGEFLLVAKYQSKISSNFKQFRMFNSAYALSCEENFENSLVDSTLKLSADKEFIYNNETIPANSNFSSIAELDIHLSEYGYTQIFFQDKFLNNVEFQNTDYTFKIYIRTSDNLELENEITLEIDL